MRTRLNRKQINLTGLDTSDSEKLPTHGGEAGPATECRVNAEELKRGLAHARRETLEARLSAPFSSCDCDFFGGTGPPLPDRADVETARSARGD